MRHQALEKVVRGTAIPRTCSRAMSRKGARKGSFRWAGRADRTGFADQAPVEARPTLHELTRKRPAGPRDRLTREPCPTATAILVISRRTVHASATESRRSGAACVSPAPRNGRSTVHRRSTPVTFWEAG